MKSLYAGFLVSGFAAVQAGCIQVTVSSPDGARVTNSYLALSVNVIDQNVTTYTKVSGFGVVKVANELTIGYAEIERASIQDDCTALIWVEDAHEFERVSDLMRGAAGVCLVYDD